MHTKCVDVAKRDREFVGVVGPDSADYLQRMVSNDVEALAVGEWCSARRMSNAQSKTTGI
jgi:folate-binding Fe-S cluster repair protein YgfZ